MLLWEQEFAAIVFAAVVISLGNRVSDILLETVLAVLNFQIADLCGIVPSY